MSGNSEQTTFLSASNAVFIKQLYVTYLQDPQSVEPSWTEFFQSLGDEVHNVMQELAGASWTPNVSADTPKLQPIAASQQNIIDSIQAQMLIRVYRVRGHLQANLDPLELSRHQLHPDLDPKSYGFKENDLDREIFLNGSLGLQSATLKEILRILRQTYCGAIGVEFMHIQDPAQKDWIQRKMENETPHFSKEDKVSILDSLTRAEDFEKFLSVKYPGAKRFGLEGGEGFLPALDSILKDSVERGVVEFILGMAHRGRLNVLTNIIGLPSSKIFSEFQVNIPRPEYDMQGSGDVKYHLGYSSDREINGQQVHLSLTANPSHLEAVNPVVVGKVRAKQDKRHDKERSKVMGILVHGDAAFAGQGLVAETLGMSELYGYRTGGTLHVIINNQIGFTTAPHLARSSSYCSDMAKIIQAPIFHVNGDDPEAVAWVAQVASEFRYLFKKDIVIDLYCYRRHGHNEMDEPAFTQPVMYNKIRTHPTTRQIYAQKLQQERVVDEANIQSLVKKYNDHLQAEFEVSKTQQMRKVDWLDGAWSKIDYKTDLHAIVKTGISKEVFDQVATALITVPQGFNLHPRLARLREEKTVNFQKGENIDWASAESLAFGSLLLEGFPVRLSGQDCGRGTFSQRHSVFYDQTSGDSYMPLEHVAEQQARIEIIDSPLSEASVLGFEHGYSLSDPDTLVLWEAQFGDFSNGAQVIIDQFVSSGEAKWLRLSGLVMLLPHGHEGQGPEHTSARFERYLQLCAEDNIQVANCTTPANYFHILRRQLHRGTRKPLVIMTPKSLLRHQLAVSRFSDFATGTYFKPVLPEVDANIVDDQVKRVVLSTGKVYYDLYENRKNQNMNDIALIRLEQLYPFSHKELLQELTRYPQASVVWCQEEPENMGAWNFIDRRLEKVMIEAKMKSTRPIYVGRHAAASPATGIATRHAREQKELIDKALNIQK